MAGVVQMVFVGSSPALGWCMARVVQLWAGILGGVAQLSAGVSLMTSNFRPLFTNWCTPALDYCCITGQSRSRLVDNRLNPALGCSLLAGFIRCSPIPGCCLSGLVPFLASFGLVCPSSWLVFRCTYSALWLLFRGCSTPLGGGS